MLEELKGYDITENGEIFSNRNWRGLGRRKLRPYKNAFGYWFVSVYNENGKRIHLYLHVVVAYIYLGPRPEGMLVLHIDGDKSNNSLSNLRYGTAKENSADRELHGRTAKGSKVGSSKLTEDQVIELRSKHKSGCTGKQLAKEYGVSETTISKIIRNLYWKEVI